MDDDFIQIQKAAVTYYNAYQAWQKDYGSVDFNKALGASIPVFRDFQSALEELPLTTPQGKLARCELDAAMERYVTLTGISRYRYLNHTPKEAYTLAEHFGGADSEAKDVQMIMGVTQNIIRKTQGLTAQEATQMLERECGMNGRAEALMELTPSIAATAGKTTKVRE